MKTISLQNITLHNLKNVSLEIPLNKLVAIAGPSGSGKSSLIYDALYKTSRGESTKFSISKPPKTYSIKQKNFKDSSSKSSGEKILEKLNSISKKINPEELLIVDEPCAGFSKKDRLIVLNLLKDLVKKGVSVIVIEHCREIILGADYVIEFGPGSGSYGGKITFHGNIGEFNRSKTRTAEYILTDKSEKVNYKRDPNKKAKSMQNKKIEIFGINKNNLKHYSVKFPLGSLVCVSGNISSGKTTLLNIIYSSLFKGKSAWKVREYLNKEIKIQGKENIRRAYFIDQTSIKAGANSNIASYIKLSSELKGKNYSSLTVDDAIKKFKTSPLIKRKLGFLQELGLGYLELGQLTKTLSGGEAQRIKLAKVLSKKLGDRCIYIFDNPSRGLHPSDLPTLVKVFQKIIDKNNTVLISENREEIIKNSDYKIKL